jgi:hypothetical protein
VPRDLTPTEAAWERRLERVRAERLKFLRKSEGSASLRAAIRRKCQYDPLWFLRHLVWSEDPRRANLGLNTRTPFLPYHEQEVMFLALLMGYNLAMDKSRDTGASYIACAAVLYSFVLRPGSVWGLSSKTGGEASDGTTLSLMGKVAYMHRHLPRCLRVPRDRLRMRTRPDGLMRNLTNGASVLARKTTPDVWHSARCSGIVFDEIARTRHSQRMVNGSRGTTNQTALITTPAGNHGWWRNLIKGEAEEQIQEMDTAAVLRGVQPEPGYHHHSLHWSMDPRYDESWAERQRASMSEAEWLINYEISYEASTPGRIWKEFSRHVHVLPDEDWDVFVRDVLPQCRIYEGGDPGLYCSFLWVAHYTDKDGADEAIILDYVSQYEHIVNAMGSIVQDWAPYGVRTGKNERGLLPAVRIGDPSIGHRNAITLNTWRNNLRELGVSITPTKALKGQTKKMRDAVSAAFREGRLWLSPHCMRKPDGVDEHGKRLPSLVDAIEQYRLLLREGDNHPEPNKGPESHPCDGLQYVVASIWPTGEPAGLYRSKAGRLVRDEAGDREW